jgi:hypothetical protein
MDCLRDCGCRRSIIWLLVLLTALTLVLMLPARAQDGNTSLQGIVADLSGARIVRAEVTLINLENGFHSSVSTDGVGRFNFAMLVPGRYTVEASAPGMADATQSGLELHVGGSMQVQLRLRPAGRAENITVLAPPALIDPESGELSQVIDEQAIANLPLNGRRFTDLALLSPGVTQDPRGLTSGSNGDLSYGGTRGYQNRFLVDEVIKEFRVSSNGYGAELGHAGGAGFKVVTNSGGNHCSTIGKSRPYSRRGQDDRSMRPWREMPIATTTLTTIDFPAWPETPTSAQTICRLMSGSARASN